MTYYENEMQNEIQNDINEIKEILKRMQKSIDKLESNSVSYGTEINTIPLTQACSEEDLLKMVQ